MKWRRALIVLASVPSIAFATGTAMAGPAGALTTSAGTPAAVNRPSVEAFPAGHWGAAQPVPGLAKLNAGGAARVEAITCSSTGSCLAGGSYQDSAHHDQVFAAFEVKGTWQPATTIPGLATLNAGGLADVASLSCGETGDCSIGGSYIDAQGNDIPWVANSVAGTWQPVQGLITTDLISIDSQLVQKLGAVNSISCATAGNCAAVLTMPSLVGGTAQAAPFVATEFNGIWGTPQPAVIDSRPGEQLPAELTTVSCAGQDAFCITGGFYTDGNEHQHAIVMFGMLTPHGPSWGGATEPPGLTALPGYGTVSPNAAVTSVSCLSTGDCAASGFYIDSAKHHQAFTGGEVNGSQWTTRMIPGMAELNTGGQAFAADMSCGDPGECAVVGDFNDSASQSQAFVDAESGHEWRNAQEIFGISNNLSAAATDVSCFGPGFCTAGGSYHDDDGHLQAFVAADGRGSWSGARKLAGNLNAGGNAGLTGISCGFFSNCVAGGFYTDAAGHQSGWVADESTLATTILSVSAATLAAGHEQAEHITVAVKPLSGGTPTGTVTVTAGSKDLCTITLAHGGGTCSLRARQLPQGSDHVTGTYSGDGTYVGSVSNSRSIKVLPARSATATALTLSAPKIKAGHEQSEHLTVRVSGQLSSTPTGKVTITTGSATICVITLAKGKGGCMLASGKLRPGSYHLTAAYPGSSSFGASISPNKVLTVTH
ncbi:MAG TPA: Ig-like domain-containing protein [Streptosporangiaceae bacterium]